MPCITILFDYHLKFLQISQFLKKSQKFGFLCEEFQFWKIT